MYIVRMQAGLKPRPHQQCGAGSGGHRSANHQRVHAHERTKSRRAEAAQRLRQGAVRLMEYASRKVSAVRDLAAAYSGQPQPVDLYTDAARFVRLNVDGRTDPPTLTATAHAENPDDAAVYMPPADDPDWIAEHKRLARNARRRELRALKKSEGEFMEVQP